MVNRRDFMKLSALSLAAGGLRLSGCAAVSAASGPHPKKLADADGSPMNVYFGDLHTHSKLSDGIPEPADVIGRARGRLDFFAFADHAQYPDPPPHGKIATWAEGVPEMIAHWGEIQKLIRDNHEPGRFITFLGYEWSSTHWGDHNVYYLNDDEPLRFGKTVTELYAAMRGVKAMVIPHHPAYPLRHRGVDWSVFKDSMAPLVEIVSQHGAAETDDGPFLYNTNMGPCTRGGTAQRGLELGHVFGFIGSTDNHGGSPGHHGAGMAAVWAPELTREALWEAFWQRRTYAITGDRIRLDFRLNGHPMGSILEAKAGGPRRIEIEIDAWDTLDTVEILKNGRVVQAWSGMGGRPAEGARHFKMPLRWGCQGAITRNHWNDFTVEIRNGSLAAFNPHYLTPSYAKPYAYLARQAGPGKLEIVPAAELKAAKTRTEQVDLDLRGGLDCEVVLHHRGECVISATLSELARNDRVALPFGPFNGYFQLARPVPETHFQARFEWEDSAGDTGLTRDYYYVRVYQRNGQAAWSSPIWTGKPTA